MQTCNFNSIKKKQTHVIILIKRCYKTANSKINYFLPGSHQKDDRKACDKATRQLQKEFEDVPNGYGCFDGTFSVQVKIDSNSYQALPRCIAYALQKPFKDELELLQQWDIITPLGMD